MKGRQIPIGKEGRKRGRRGRRCCDYFVFSNIFAEDLALSGLGWLHIDLMHLGAMNWPASRKVYYTCSYCLYISDIEESSPGRDEARAKNKENIKPWGSSSSTHLLSWDTSGAPGTGGWPIASSQVESKRISVLDAI